MLPTAAKTCSVLAANPTISSAQVGWLCLQGGVAAQLRPAPADLEKGLRSRRLAYYSQCELVVYEQHKGAVRSFRGDKARFRKGCADGSSDEEEGNQKDAASVFLQIR